MRERFRRPRLKAQISVAAAGRKDRFSRESSGEGTALQGKLRRDVELGVLISYSISILVSEFQAHRRILTTGIVLRVVSLSIVVNKKYIFPFVP